MFSFQVWWSAEFLFLKVLLSIALHNLDILALNIPLFSSLVLVQWLRHGFVLTCCQLLLKLLTLNLLNLIESGSYASVDLRSSFSI